MTNMWYLFLILLGLFACSASQCPPAELITPCTCSNNSPYLQCVDIFDMEVLAKVFERSADYSFPDFFLYNSSVMYLPASKIVFKRVKQLLVVNTTMTALFDRELVVGNKLELIWLVNVQFQRGVGWELFHNLKNLKSFKSQKTEIKTLGKTFTDNISPTITHFVLDGANTRKVQYNAFVNLKNLMQIEISNAQIKSLSRSMFPKPAVIDSFNFRENQITSLPEDLFSDMPKIREINLENNKITTLSEKVFGSVYEKLFHLYVTGNPIKCDCGIRWLLNKRNTIAGALHGDCDYPDDKKGKYIAWLAYDDFKYCDK